MKCIRYHQPTTYIAALYLFNPCSVKKRCALLEPVLEIILNRRCREGDIATKRKETHRKEEESRLWLPTRDGLLRLKFEFSLVQV